MILLVHCGKLFNSINCKNFFFLLNLKGEEHTVNAGFLDNSLGNPLFCRKALDMGVKIIAAHVASEGHNIDIDNP